MPGIEDRHISDPASLRERRQNFMDQIEKGFKLLVRRIEETKGKDELIEEVKKNDAALLSRMAKSAKPLIPRVGLNMLQRGKQDTKGNLYDTAFTRMKMIVLGKTDQAGSRPDNPSMKVDDQFCVFAEDGQFYELMYSNDGFLVDSLLQPITPDMAISRYGIDVMIMLYRALHDYLEKEEELIRALKVTLTYIYPEKFAIPRDQEE